MTRAGYVLGTPYYMAPEQVTGQNVTEQVDVYAFGVLVFELMTGVKPIAGETVERIFYSILNEPLNVEPMRQAGVPQALCDLVSKCTMKNAADRPQGFGPVVAELERMLAELDAPTMYLPSAAPVEQVAGHPAWLVPVLIGVVLVLAAGLYFVMKPKKLAETVTAKSGEMVLVPAGSFKFGENKEDAPPLPAFYIDKTEVTNQAYEAFCKAANHATPPDFPPDKPGFPVVNVTIEEAKAFAKWAGERLPTAREWEKAARGTDGRLYPWGNEKDASRASLGPNGSLHPAVDFAGSASPFKTLQMVGNVWELLDERTTPSDRAIGRFAGMQPAPTMADAWYEARGGSYLEPIDNVAIYDWTPVPAQWKYKDIGFRCVKDVH